MVSAIRREGIADGNPTEMPRVSSHVLTERQFHIRKAGLDDGEAIMACLRAAFDKYRDQYTPHAFADTVPDLKTIGQRLRDMCLFVAIADGKTVGTIGAAVSDDHGHLRGMAVLPEWQGTGVAAALLRAAEDELRNKGCKHVTLDTTEPLTRAIQFYQKHGFAASSRISDFFGMNLYEYKKPL